MFGANAPAGEALTIAKADYDAFERLLQDVQADFSAEDLNALRTKVTPEMLSYFSEQFAENASRGLLNKVTDVKLEQGDLAEAWREGEVDYATVAMRFRVNRPDGRACKRPHRGRRRARRGHRTVDLYAGKWRRLARVGDSAGVANRDHAPLSAGSFALDAMVAPGFGVAARMRSSSHVSNFTPSSRGLRHITRQRRCAVPFAASNNRKLSGITSESGMLIRAPMCEISDKAQSRRSPPPSISQAS